MFRLVTCVVIVSLFSPTFQQENGKSVQELIADLFPKPEPKNPDASTTGPVNPVTLQPASDNCICVPYYLCNNNSKINTNGEGLIDLRADEGECSTYMEVCCMPPEITKIRIIPIETEKPKGCGRRNPDGVGVHAIGDVSNEAQFGEFPWMVAILHEETMPGVVTPLIKYQCGGSLIHPQAVLTSTHCVASKEKHFKVRAGEWDTQTEKEIFPYQDRDVKAVIKHPNYYSGALFNDIAILILESPFEMVRHINVVCLPPQGTVIPSGTRCFATGWGKDVFGQLGKYQVILKKIELPIVERQTCQHNLRNTRLGKHFQLHESFVCAGGEPGIDTCKGDGGSPLVCPVPGENNRYQQVGIVAWGIGCGENQVPGVYANVALFRNWINEQLKLNNLETSTYEY